METLKAYDWKTCQINVYDVEENNAMSVAMHALSDPWQNIDRNRPCRKAWRIYDHKCSILPDEVFGQFHMQDIYLLLVIKVNNMEKNSVASVDRNVHVWVGKYSDESCYQQGFIWANKLDELLSRDCILHREVQGMESQQFRTYFNPVTYYNGSFAESYWMKRVRNEYQPARMLKLYKPDKLHNFIVAVEVPCKASELDPAFTFLLDVSHTIYLWHGNLTPSEEDTICTSYAEGIRAARGLQCRVEALDDDTEHDAHEFFTYLSRDTYRSDANTSRDEDENSTLHRQSTLMRHKVSTVPNELYKFTISKVKGQVSAIKYDKIKENNISRADINKLNIALVDTKESLFIVMGKKALKSQENSLGLKFAHEFLKASQMPYKSVTVLRFKQNHHTLDTILQLA